jgi:hypothetical protein
VISTAPSKAMVTDRLKKSEPCVEDKDFITVVIRNNDKLNHFLLRWVLNTVGVGGKP